MASEAANDEFLPAFRAALKEPILDPGRPVRSLGWQVALRNGRVVVTSGGWAEKENPWERRRSLLAYSEDEPRDEQGRWTGEGGGTGENVAHRSDGRPMVVAWPTDQMDDHPELPGHWVPAEEVPDYLYHVGPREFEGEPPTIDSIRTYGLLPKGGDVGEPHPGQDWDSDIDGVFGHETLGGALQDAENATENYDGAGRYGIYRFVVPEEDKWQVRADSESSLAMTAPVPPTRIDVWEGDDYGNGHFEPLLPGGTLAGPADPPANLNDSGTPPVGHLNRWNETASAALLGYSEDQPRDDRGRWSPEGGGGADDGFRVDDAYTQAVDRVAARYGFAPASQQQFETDIEHWNVDNEEVAHHAYDSPLEAWRKSEGDYIVRHQGEDEDGPTPDVPRFFVVADGEGDMNAAGGDGSDTADVASELEGLLQEAGFSPTGATAAALLAYSEEQPRDEHGRWTSGGAGGGDADFSGLTTDQVEAKLNERYPKTTFDLGNMTEESAQRMASSWARVADKYPDVAAEIPKVAVLRAIDGMPEGALGVTFGRGSEQANTIGLASYAWTRDGYFEQLEPYVQGGGNAHDPEDWRKDNSIGTFWPSSYTSNEDGIQGAIVTHEFGHALGNVYPDTENAFNNGFDENIKLGGYADFSGRERFADVFEMMQQGDPGKLTEDQNDAVKALRGVFKSEGLRAAALLAYSEDQPRDEHGRWTDGEGGSSLDEKLPPPASELDKAIEYYHSPRGPADLNAALRNGHELTPEQQGVVNALDAGMRPLEETTIVYRGVPDSTKAFGVPTEELNALVGSRQTDAAFMSTSTDPQTADIFGSGVSFLDDDPVVVEIEVPAGYPALPIPEGDYGNQQELLLPRGTQLEFDYVPPFGGAERQVDSHLILAHVVQGRQLTGATLLAYSEDQPRDDHGRWSGGGGDAGPIDGKTLTQVEKQFNDRFKGQTTLKADGISVEAANAVANSFVRNAEAFPETASHVASIQAKPADPEDPAWVATAERTSGGYPSGLDPNTGEPGDYDIVLNQSYFRDPELILAGVQEEWWPESYRADPFGAIVTHEFGHVMDFNEPQLGIGSIGDVARSELGGYAAMGSNREAFAEVYQMMMEGQPGQLTEAQQEAVDNLRAVLKPGVTAAALLGYSDDQPRDEHGRWTSSGGGDDASAGPDKLLGPSAERAKAALGDQLHIEDPTSAAVKQNLADLGRVPTPLLEATRNEGLQVYVADRPVYQMDTMEMVQYQVPNPNDVNGAYQPSTNELVLAQPWTAEATAETGMDTNTAVHEFGHAVEGRLFTDYEEAQLQSWHASLRSELTPYERGSFPGSAWASKELWGETFATRFLYGKDAVAERYSPEYADWAEGVLTRLGAWGATPEAG